MLRELQLRDLKDETEASAAASEMALVHNMIIRGLNSIYLQAPNIKLEKDVKDFLTYMYSWSLLVHMHHDNEEGSFHYWKSTLVLKDTWRRMSISTGFSGLA
jgi:hypothetical protein